MDRRYEAYCLADPYFYDHPARREDLAPPFAHTRRPAPPGWSASAGGDWWHLLPDRRDLPEQGWKIHVSATPADAERVLDLVWDACTGEGLAFKFLRSRGLLFLRNSKYAERGASGKFVTVYPRDESELEDAVGLLDRALSGTPGPYILSDLRIGAGPVFVRYGAFTPRRVLSEDGEQVPALAHPDGHLVPDRRTPVFSPPAWVTLPEFLRPHLAARDAVNLADLPYRVERALHFSNGGGVYQGTDTRTGRAVVLKEARPHAGLIADGRDAVARLAAEQAALEHAAGAGAGPEVIDAFTLGEHRFLVLEHVPGRTLNNLFGERFPLIGADPDPEAVRAYTAWALGIARRVEQAVAALHERGIVFNDLHLFNIMVRPDDTVSLIDFEVAALTEQAGRQTLASRAFQAPRGTSGPAVDRYALACLRLALFLPLTSLLALDRARAGAMAHTIRAEFPDVPDDFLDEAVAVITAGIGQDGSGAEHRELSGDERGDAPGDDQGPENYQTSAKDQGSATAGGTGLPESPSAGQAGARTRAIPAARTGAHDADPVDALRRLDWPALRASLAAGITAVASPEREDRLYPGDVAQFAGPGAGLGLAHGAAGVLYALHAVGAPVPEEHVAWLVKRAGELPRDTGAGLYDGALGIAYALDLLGRADAAAALVERVLEERWQRLGHALSDGLAGIGLGLLHFADHGGDAAVLGAALEAGRLAADLLAQDAEHARDAAADAGTRRRAGLLRGASGPALLFTGLFEHTGDTDWLTRAGAALRLDLGRCVHAERDGSLRVDEGWRALPYLGEGSAGIGLAARRYLRHRTDADLAAAVSDIDRASDSRFYAQAGLFNGRAGLVLALAAGAYESSAVAGAADGGPSASAQARETRGAKAADAASAASAGPARTTTQGSDVSALGPGPGRQAPGAVGVAGSPAVGAGPWPRRQDADHTQAGGDVADGAAVSGPGAQAGFGSGGPDTAASALAPTLLRARGQARRLAWHALVHRGSLAFPGDQLHRLSTDLATGSAGVLLALGAALHDTPVTLPALGAGSTAAPPTPPHPGSAEPGPATATAPGTAPGAHAAR